MPSKQRIAVIGGGPAGLMAAEELANAGFAATVYDRMASVGRKFLLAGRGGLNLTHSEPLETFLARYRPAPPPLIAAIRAFPPERLRAWCEALGQPTFVGSSGRVFPEAMKASPLLRAWLRRLQSAGVTFALRHRLAGWDDAGNLVFARPDGTAVTDRPDATVLALGGASWPRLGSDGAWAEVLGHAGVAVVPLLPANCGFRADWSAEFGARRGGAPLKRIAVTFGERTVRGEAVITQDGLEGGAIYALSGSLRDAIASKGDATATVDLRPDLGEVELTGRLAGRRKKETLSTALRKHAKLSPPAIDLLREAAARAGIRLSDLPPAQLARLIKAAPVRLVATAPIGRAISTAGGVAFDAIDDHFMLHQRPGVFVAGEMLDWEAPTGGYLLQASFATGIAAARGAIDFVRGRAPFVALGNDFGMRLMKIAVLPGDDIGPEITEATLLVLQVADRRFGLDLDFDLLDVGMAAHRKTGTTLPAATIEAARRADGIILGPCGVSTYPPAGEGGVNVPGAIRKLFDLYANLRPARSRPPLPRAIPGLDCLIVRENTEGFYADRALFHGPGEFMPTPDCALSVRRITAQASRRIAKVAFEAAQHRRGRITVVGKRHVLQVTDGLFFAEVKSESVLHPNVTWREMDVDAMAADLYTRPEDHDVILTTNMFGDILSNEALALSGSLGLAQSLNTGDGHAAANAGHGSAPDIAGRGVANPAGLMLSAAMLLRWLGERHQLREFTQAAVSIEAAADAAMLDPASRTADLGGHGKTRSFAEAVVREMRE